jgi:hypothetical protein
MPDVEVVYEPEEWPDLVSTGQREGLKAWLIANGIDPAVVPIHAPISIETAKRRRLIRYTAYLRNADGRKYLDEATGDAAQEQRTVPLVVDRPPQWRTSKEQS